MVTSLIILFVYLLCGIAVVSAIVFVQGFDPNDKAEQCGAMLVTFGWPVFVLYFLCNWLWRLPMALFTWLGRH